MSSIDSLNTELYKTCMFGISGEHLLVFGIILLIFGPRRLPELGNTLGKAIRNFKDAISGIEEAKFRKLDEKDKAPNQTTQAIPDPNLTQNLANPNTTAAHSPTTPS